jgi:hypothetical protein
MTDMVLDCAIVMWLGGINHIAIQFLFVHSIAKTVAIVLLENIYNTRPTGTCETCSCSEIGSIFTNVLKPKLRRKSRLNTFTCEMILTSSTNASEIGLTFHVLVHLF